MATELNSSPLLEDANLENYYRHSSGALTTDSSGNSRTLTQVGTVSAVTGGQFGYCASATFGNVNYLTGTSFNPGTGAVTIGCWFKKNGAPTDDYSPTFLSFNGTGSNPRFYLVANKTTGYAMFSTYDGASTGVTLSQNVNICDNAWHLVVATRTGTTHKLYVDGAEVGSVSGTIRDINTTRFQVGAGYIESASDRIGDALIDDVFVFSKALSASEVLSLYRDSYAEIYSETITIADSVSNSVSRILSDVITIAENIDPKKIFEKIISEVITITDSVTKTITRTVSDSVTIAESFVKSIQRILTDQVSIIDTIEKLFNYAGKLPAYIYAKITKPVGIFGKKDKPGIGVSGSVTSPTGFTNDKDKPGIGVAHSVDKPERV